MAVIVGDDVEFTTAAGPSPPGGLAPCQSPMWRFISTSLSSATITILDRVAADRHVHPLLGAPNWLSFTVPSDSPLVNIPVGGGDPYVAEGNRLIYAFRQESNVSTDPYFVCRGAGTVMQVEDTAQQDDSRTKVVAFDTWGLAAKRPACATNGNRPVPFEGWDGIYPPGTTVGEIITSQFENSEANYGPLRCLLDPANVESTLAWSDTTEYVVQPGMSVADVWTAMVSTGKCDLIFEPFYDPTFNPGITHKLFIYQQAGADLPSQIFGWDRAPHSLLSLSRMIDGTQRANNVSLGAGMGASYGVPVAPSVDAASVTKFGQYWAQQVLPGVIDPVGLVALQDFQLELRKDGRTTVQMSPTPERSPCPFQEYNLGDRVPVYASGDNFRQVLSGYVRIYGFPIDISDDALERVQGMILLPQGIL